MEPYYRDDACSIYHGESEDVLPLLGSFDLLLTDPPYGIGEANGKNKSRGKIAVSRDYGAESWDDKPISPELLSLVRGCATHQIIFGGNYYNLPPSPCWLVWDKDNGKTDFADCELAWTNLSTAVRKIRYKWQGMLQEHGGRRKEARFHPTQKPVAVMKWCITKAPDNCRTIIDPFMGSGSTLRAAKDEGLIAVGIDATERYCEIAANRLSQEVLF